MSDILLKAFGRRLRARYQARHDLNSDMARGMLRLAWADMDRLPKAHRCSA